MKYYVQFMQITIIYTFSNQKNKAQLTEVPEIEDIRNTKEDGGQPTDTYIPTGNLF